MSAITKEIVTDNISDFLRYEADFYVVRESLRKFMYASIQMHLDDDDGTFTKELSDGFYYTNRLIEVLEYHNKIASDAIEV